MGLFSFIKKNLLKVIEWQDDSKDLIVYRYDVPERYEIMTSSKLVVRESQCAVFISKGQIADIFGPGTYSLKTENIPFLSKILALPYGGEMPITADVYFVNTKQFTGQKWGTQNPIMMRDADFGSIRLRGYGVYSFKVDKPDIFMKEMFGTNQYYKTEDVAAQCKPMVIQSITDAIAESKISALDLAANYREFSDTVLKCSEVEFSKYGLKLCSIVMENLSLPEEVEKMLDERTKMGIMEDKMGTFTQFQAAQAIRDAAQNEGGGNLAGLGVGLGAGTSIGNMFAANLTTQNTPKQAPVQNEAKAPATAVVATTVTPTVKCVNCGADIKPNAKFCPECGSKQSKVCSECGAVLKTNAKFCSECGNKVE